MTIFENRIYRIIIEYLWFDSKNKSYARSLCLVNWYFHRVICSLNISFNGSHEKLNQLFTHHFQRQSSDLLLSQALNKCALFSSLTELRIGNLSSRNPLPLDDLKLILPHIRSFSCIGGPNDYELMVSNGMHSLECLEINTDTSYFNDFELLSPNLKQLKMVLHRLNFDYYDFSSFVPLTKYLVSEAFQKLTSLDIVDTNINGSYCYFIMDSKYSSVLFDGLLNFQSLQHLGFTFVRDIKIVTEFKEKLLEYLEKQKTLRSFDLPHMFYSIDSDCLWYLVRNSSIEQLSINICEMASFHFPTIQRDNLKKLTVIVDKYSTSLGNLSTIKHIKVIQRRSERSSDSFERIKSLFKAQKNLQDLHGFKANRVLKYVIPFDESKEIDNDFLQALKNNTTLKRFYLRWELWKDFNSKKKPIEDIIQNHPTIRNKECWLSKYKWKEYQSIEY
ncbi:hypothetical protein PPL_00863 [Heterostelium album PN500]|uniref:F-box domain-containing protein n=1 Tax=Heterostelium pallidum (strain ATCC 26659 / Pp 5 / PN500) TaxID=670386 RepID=D3AYU4_HETP5|nr:hypothetical protein PPL_00863 [Heterostelium album PN500]EFA85634.1 hypothetical protein PPL_00863 [Heterostelium album PN500]|eukprot:XP_020437741.1 hypothetical protein PPL_00863 [Heterostelium album PN500]